MDPQERGRGGRRARGRPPLGIREIEILEGEDIVSRLDHYALQEGISIMFINNAIGIVSNLAVEGHGIINAGAYQIEALQGVWSDFHFNGEHFLVDVTVRNMNNREIVIRGSSSFLLSANNIRVFVEVI